MPDSFPNLIENINWLSHEIDEYRFHLNRARRKLVRDRVLQLVSEINAILAGLERRFQPCQQPVDDDAWLLFVRAFTEVERLTGNSVPRKARWAYIRRHIAGGLGQDLHDIITADWPSVLEEIQDSLYSELEPLPVQVENLASLVAAKPTGSVTTKLIWNAISADDFERLLFNIVADVSEASDQMSLWEPPTVHVLVFATSGRFTADAVAWVEKHNDNNGRPHIEMWPDSHLELLLASRPHLVAEFRLR